MNRRDLEIWAGQMLAVGPAGTRMDADLGRLIEEAAIGGVILFSRNCPDSDRVRGFVETMQRRAKTPLFVMIDQEGGRVMRLSERRFRLPAARELAKRKPADLEKDVVHVAKRLREIGINVNLAPVLDVDSNPDNPVIGDRAFGTDVETVWNAAQSYMNGLRKAGIIGCGKHFPGHGDTDEDSHLTLPVVSHGRDRLFSMEIEPFRRAILANWDMLMSAHCLYPALDPDEPATLSASIGRDLLRGELGFTGVLMADDLEMKAIASRHSLMERVFLLLQAETDILPVCHTYSLAFDVHRCLVRLAEDGRIDPLRLKASHDRILDLKTRRGLFLDRLA